MGWLAATRDTPLPLCVLVIEVVVRGLRGLHPQGGGNYYAAALLVRAFWY